MNLNLYAWRKAMTHRSEPDQFVVKITLILGDFKK